MKNVWGMNLENVVVAPFRCRTKVHKLEGESKMVSAHLSCAANIS